MMFPQVTPPPPLPHLPADVVDSIMSCLSLSMTYCEVEVLNGELWLDRCERESTRVQLFECRRVCRQWSWFSTRHCYHSVFINSYKHAQSWAKLVQKNLGASHEPPTHPGKPSCLWFTKRLILDNPNMFDDSTFHLAQYVLMFLTSMPNLEVFHAMPTLEISLQPYAWRVIESLKVSCPKIQLIGGVNLHFAFLDAIDTTRDQQTIKNWFPNLQAIKLIRGCQWDEMVPMMGLPHVSNVPLRHMNNCLHANTLIQRSLHFEVMSTSEAYPYNGLPATNMQTLEIELFEHRVEVILPCVYSLVSAMPNLTTLCIHRFPGMSGQAISWDHVAKTCCNISRLELCVQTIRFEPFTAFKDLKHLCLLNATRWNHDTAGERGREVQEMLRRLKTLKAKLVPGTLMCPTMCSKNALLMLVVLVSNVVCLHLPGYNSFQGRLNMDGGFVMNCIRVCRHLRQLELGGSTISTLLFATARAKSIRT